LISLYGFGTKYTKNIFNKLKNMTGIEVHVINLKIPSLTDFSKVKCIVTAGSSSQSTLYPFKPVTFNLVDSNSIISVSIFHMDKVIGGIDIPIALDAYNKPKVFKLSDSYKTPDRRPNSVNKTKEVPEIILSIKPAKLEETFTPAVVPNEKKVDLKHLLEESYKSRRELQLSIEETTHQLQDIINSQDEIIKQDLKEKQDLRQELLNIENLLDLEKNKLKVANAKLFELQNLSDTWKNIETQTKSTQNWCSEISLQSERSLQQQSQMMEKMKKNTQDFTKTCIEYETKLDNLLNDKISLMKNLEILQKDMNALKYENSQLESELLKYKSKIGQLQAEVEISKGAQSRELELVSSLKSSENLITSLKEELNKSTEFYKDSLSKLVNTSNQLLRENQDCLTKLYQSQQLIQQKDTQIQTLLQEKNKLASDLACMEQHLCIQEDSNQIIDSLTADLKSSQAENKEKSIKINDLNTKNFNNTKKIHEIQNELKEKSDEIEVLMSTVMRLQKKDSYVPVSNDPIDSAMADYLNTMDTPLKVPFTREDEGIYLFGTKRIFVKLEQGKIIIRVGGGFMHVDEFIDVYTISELEKFARQQAEKSQKVRQSFLNKLSEGRESPSKFSACYGVQRKSDLTTKVSSGSMDYTNSY
jgi:Growth-Arrest-Specific Protein 2 Domain